MLTAEENDAFRDRLKTNSYPALTDVLSEWEWSYDSYTPPPPPEEHMRHLEDLLYGLELEFPDDDELKRQAELVAQGIEEFVAATSRPEREYDDNDWYREDSAVPPQPSRGHAACSTIFSTRHLKWSVRGTGEGTSAWLYISYAT